MHTTLLIIIDGFGIRKEKKGNAIKNAHTPNLDYAFKHNPYTELYAYGKHVGLPKGFQGSSEVGHLNIGAGRIVPQEEVRIDTAIKNKTFYKNRTLLNAINNAKKHNTRIHIMGLLQDQGVHAHQNHLFALLKLCKKEKITPLLHIFTDGRDTPPISARTYLNQLHKTKLPFDIATITGRYYAMDRDNRWNRTKKAYNAITKAKGTPAKSWKQALIQAYTKHETDEFITPKILNNYTGTQKNDLIITFNYRSDRARQITKALLNQAPFKTPHKKINYLGMVEYYKAMPSPYIFDKPHPKNNYGEYLAKKGKKQLRIAETEKYAHVTYFFSGEREKPFKKEKRILIPSPKVATYDTKPEMSAKKITQAALKNINKHNTIIINYANCDMVGHTGNYPATLKAVQTVDTCIGKLIKANKQSTTIITADHGNAETMKTKDNKTVTSHTATKVPFCIITNKKIRLKPQGKLGDIIPTLLALQKLKKPKEMTGKNLLLT